MIQFVVIPNFSEAVDPVQRGRRLKKVLKSGRRRGRDFEGNPHERKVVDFFTRRNKKRGADHFTARHRAQDAVDAVRSRGGTTSSDAPNDRAMTSRLLRYAGEDRRALAKGLNIRGSKARPHMWMKYAKDSRKQIKDKLP